MTVAQHGKNWRLLANVDSEAFEVGDKGTFDELVVDDWLHIEQMDANVWWMRVGDARVMITLEAAGPPVVDVQRGFYAEPAGTTDTVGPVVYKPSGTKIP